MLERHKEPPPPAPADAREALPLDRHARRIARTALALGLGVLGLWVAADFLAPLGWAAILAITLWPLYARFVATGEHAMPLFAPLIFTVLTGLIVFVPVALVAQQLARQGQAFVTWVNQARESGIPVPAWLAQVPVAADSAQQLWAQNLSDPKAAGAWFQSVNVDKATEWTSALGGQLLHRSLMFLVCLVALFVFLRHGRWLSARLLDTADRVFGDPGEHLASKMVEAVRGTFLGTVVVAVVEGLLIGGAYVLAGVPSAALFTLLTVAFAMVPFGAWAAFSAAALAVLFSDGSLWAALAVFGWGAVVMLIGDHFGWPALVGKSARLPFLLALVGVFGGLQAFGLIGLFLGPVIMAALMTVWREWLVQSEDARGAQD
jgi:predicted PurR-regulated permease PerM